VEAFQIFRGQIAGSRLSREDRHEGSAPGEGLVPTSSAIWTSGTPGSSHPERKNAYAKNEYRDGLGANWDLFIRSGRKVQKDLDIAEYTDTEHKPMIPQFIVLEPGIVIFQD